MRHTARERLFLGEGVIPIRVGDSSGREHVRDRQMQTSVRMYERRQRHLLPEDNAADLDLAGRVEIMDWANKSAALDTNQSSMVVCA